MSLECRSRTALTSLPSALSLFLLAGGLAWLAAAPLQAQVVPRLQTETAIVDVTAIGYGLHQWDLPLSAPVDLETVSLVASEEILMQISWNAQSGTDRFDVDLALLSGGVPVTSFVMERHINSPGASMRFTNLPKVWPTPPASGSTVSLPVIDAVRLSIQISTLRPQLAFDRVALWGLRRGLALRIHFVHGAFAPDEPEAPHERRRLEPPGPLLYQFGNGVSEWTERLFSEPVPTECLAFVAHEAAICRWRGLGGTLESQLIVMRGGETAYLALDDPEVPPSPEAAGYFAELNWLVPTDADRERLEGWTITGWRGRLHFLGESMTCEFNFSFETDDVPADFFFAYDPALCAQASSPRFRRGDSNHDAAVDISDGIHLLAHLFQGGAPPPCRSAADADDNGVLEITDAVYLFGYLFRGGSAPPAPGPAHCGEDETPDDRLDCIADQCV
jgi:hypothetical protein